MNKKTKIDYKKLIYAIVICQAAGIIGSIATVSAIETWYITLYKPFFTPPNWVFGPVWTLLYLLMGISLYLVWIKDKKASNWFWIQLALNTLWSFVFFGAQSPGWALWVIGALWMAIYRLIKDFEKIDKRSAYLLYPYLAWVSFATLLNFAIWLIN